MNPWLKVLDTLQEDISFNSQHPHDSSQPSSVTPDSGDLSDIRSQLSEALTYMQQNKHPYTYGIFKEKSLLKVYQEFNVTVIENSRTKTKASVFPSHFISVNYLSTTWISFPNSHFQSSARL